MNCCCGMGTGSRTMQIENQDGSFKEVPIYMALNELTE
eukprot:CAMPEP_0116876990 /NCGR_PEP_ID=MMETSP0463-20121206/8833_1 /TAXON_ID=181622 /ORGANISM="Strombidinopsis sp, Strain SopsisLIS2011" /LENGTH=37 /DNA_ID= /DNA_START= /DNA_END= /DNA_ORIENTATION=